MREDEAGEDGGLNAAVQDLENAGIVPVNAGKLGLRVGKLRDQRRIGRVGGALYQCGSRRGKGIVHSDNLGWSG